jgi:hypothetical protein
MAKKVDPIKAKQAKQKKIVIGGSVLLLLLLALQGPKLLKAVGGGGSEDVPQWLQDSRAQSSGAAPAPAVPGAPLAAPTLAGGNPTGATATPATGATGLVADEKPTAGPGQLASFTRFASKDPFAPQVGSGTKSGPTVPPPPTPDIDGSAGDGVGDGGSGGVVPTAPAGGSGGKGGTTTTPSAGLTSVVIAVNGVLATVTAGSDFGSGPTGQPLFHLISATATTAKVAVAGGSYANGAPAITLRLRKPVTLMNTADGTRYKLELYPPGTAVAATGTTTATAAAPAATTTTAGTTTTAP